MVTLNQIKTYLWEDRKLFLTKGSNMTLHDDAHQAFEKAIEMIGEKNFKNTTMFLNGRRSLEPSSLDKAA